MYTGLLHLHNLLRWVIIILLVIAIVKSFSGMTGKKPFTKGDKKTGLFLMIAAHIQLLIGLYEWFFGAWGLKLIQKIGMGEAMKEPAYRFWAVEHLTGMLIAIVLITIGRGASKKNIPDQAKHSKTFWFFLIAFIIILAVVPWPFREAIARPLFPGM
ncbi:MAG TPA: hypothetical protein PK339_16670 [Flavitalea sp.]|nr:hypothetical protein [Flavitalea sp.]